MARSVWRALTAGMGSPWRRVLKRFHPEGIPWPASVLYNALSSTEIFTRHYELVATDVARYGHAGRILDIGTGPGHFLPAMREVLPDTRLVGVDISASMAAQARRNLKKHGRDPRIAVGVSSASALPFADRTFDRVISTGSLHHWKEPLRALSEAHRILKPDGVALMYDLVRDMPQAVYDDMRHGFGRLRIALLWLHSFEEPFLSAEEMCALGTRTEFVVEGTRFAGALCCLVLRKAAG